MALFERGGLQQDTGLLRERWNQEGVTGKSAFVSVFNAAATLMTVTAGKSFYMKSISFYCDNIATRTMRDGTNTLLGLAAGTANTQYDVVFNAPLKFDTDVNITSAGGTWKVTVVGWEE